MSFEEQFPDFKETTLYNPMKNNYYSEDAIMIQCLSKARVKELFDKYIKQWETADFNTEFDFDGLYEELGLGDD